MTIDEAVKKLQAELNETKCAIPDRYEAKLLAILALLPEEKKPFWIEQEGSLSTCAGCGEHYICNCKGWNSYRQSLLKILEGQING